MKSVDAPFQVDVSSETPLVAYDPDSVVEKLAESVTVALLKTIDVSDKLLVRESQFVSDAIPDLVSLVTPEDSCLEDIWPTAENSLEVLEDSTMIAEEPVMEAVSRV